MVLNILGVYKSFTYLSLQEMLRFKMWLELIELSPIKKLRRQPFFLRTILKLTNYVEIGLS